MPNYAGFWKRVGAYILDMVIWTIIGSIIIIPICMVAAIMVGVSASQLKTDNPDPAIIGAMLIFEGGVIILALILYWLYHVLFEASALQATPGKMIFGIHLTTVDGNRVSFWRATGRFLGRLVSALLCYVGFLMPLFTEKKQTLHDMMAGTVVVNK